MAVASGSAACSSSTKPGSSSPSATSPTASSSPAAQAAGAPIKIGLICTCSGAGGIGALFVAGENAYTAWAKTVNSSGGINGHPVQVIAEDDAGDPAHAVSDAKTLVSDQVVALADISVADQAFASTVQAAHIPVVGVLGANMPFGTNPDFYPETETIDTAAQAGVTTAKVAGATNLGVIYCAEAPACAQAVPLLRAAGKRLGVPVIFSAETSAAAPNYTAQCVAAKEHTLTAVFITGSQVVAARVASDCAQQTYTPIYVTGGYSFQMSEVSSPGFKNGLWVDFPAIPFFANTPAVAAADAALDRYYPGMRENGNLFTESDFTAWISGMLLEDAVKAGGLTAGDTPTAAGVTRGLNSLKGDTVHGLTVPLTFTAGQPHRVACYFTARVQNGAPTLQNNGQITCVNGSSS